MIDKLNKGNIIIWRICLIKISKKNDLILDKKISIPHYWGHENNIYFHCITN